MSQEARHAKLRQKTQRLLQGTLKHARVVALAASLVPLATVVVSPVFAQQCSGCPPPTAQVPEPSSLLLLGTGLAGVKIVKQLRKK